MKKRHYRQIGFIIIFFLAALFSACTNLSTETLAFIDETNSSGVPESESEEPETTGFDFEREVFRDFDPTAGNYANSYSRDGDMLYFPYFFGRYPGMEDQILVTANRKTGIMEPLCGKPDCSHDNQTCDACQKTVILLSPVITATERRVYTVSMEQLTGVQADIILILRAFDLETKTWSELSRISLKEAGVAKEEYQFGDQIAFFHRDCFYFCATRYQTYENRQGEHLILDNTALIYRLPITQPKQWEMIFEESFPDDDVVFLHVTAYGENLICTFETGEKPHDEESMDFENARTRIIRYDLSGRNAELLYEEKIEIGVEMLYPVHDALYLETLYREETQNTPEGAVLRLDYEQKTMEKVVSGPEYSKAWLDFYDGGFFLLEKPSTYGSYIDVDHLSCTFFDLQGKELRSFSYLMPEELLPENPAAWFHWCMYLGADRWNLYFRDTYSMQTSELTGYSVVYAVPVSGDQPVLFQWAE